MVWGSILLLAIGLPGAVWPYKVARFEEQLDSIGSKRAWHEVEPANWKVTVTRIIGLAMVTFGIVGLLPF